MSDTPKKRKEDVEELDNTPRKRRMPSSASASSSSSVINSHRQRRLVYPDSDSSDSTHSTPSVTSRSSLLSNSESLVRDLEEISVAGTDHASNRFDSDDDDTLDNLNPRKLKLRGAEYELFKPKRKTGLYASLFINSDNLEGIVETWISKYQQNPDFLATLIQLFVDVLGHQDFITQNYYNGNATDYLQLKANLEKRHPKSHYKCKCILNSQSTFGRSFMDTLFSFLHQLLYACHKHGIMYGMNFMGCFVFLKHLVDTKYRMMKLTAVIFATKFITTILFIGRELQKETDEYDSESSNATTTPQQHQQDLENIESLNCLLETFLYIFYKNCDLHDVKLHYMRYVCVTEMRHWFKYAPAEFITGELLKILGRLVADENAKVREAAVKTSIAIMTERNIEYAQNHATNFDRLCSLVGSTVRDVNDRVRCCAIRFFICYTKIYPNAMKPEIRNYILLRMYAKNVAIAKECGKFFYANMGGLEGAGALKTIVSLKFTDQFADKLSLVVESLIGEAPEIDLTLMVNILIQDSADTGFEPQEEGVLIEMIYHLTHILAKGSTEFKTKRKPLDNNNTHIATKLLPQMEYLLAKFAEQDDCLIWLIKTLLLLNYQNVPFARHQEQIWEIINSLARILETNQNEDVQILVSKFFKAILEGHTMLQTRGTAVLDSFMDDIVKKFTVNYYKYPADQISENSSEMDSIKHDIRLIAVLIEHHDLTALIEWHYLFNTWGVNPINEEVVKYQMIASRWFLHWHIKRLMSEEATDNLIADLNSLNPKIISYLDASLGVLKTSKIHALKSTAYLCICNVFTDVANLECYYQTKNKRLGLIEEIFKKSPNCSEYLLDFIMLVCFNGANVPRDDKRMYLIKFLFLTIRCQLSMQNMSKVLQHYGAYTELYKDIFEAAFATIDRRSSKTIVGVVLNTLISVFEKGQRDDVKEIMLLSTALSEIFPKQRHSLLVQLGLNYVMNDEHKSRFLFAIVMKPFAKRMPMNGRVQTLNYMKEKFKTSNLRHDSIVKLTVCLKTKNVRGMLATDVRSGFANLLEDEHSDTDYAIDDHFSDEDSSSIT